MNQNIFKRFFICKFNRLENHSCYPEENNVITCYKYICREIKFKIFTFFIWPTHRRERPKRCGEPRIKHIFILIPVLWIDWRFLTYVTFTGFFMVLSELQSVVYAYL